MKWLTSRNSFSGKVHHTPMPRLNPLSKYNETSQLFFFYIRQDIKLISLDKYLFKVTQEVKTISQEQCSSVFTVDFEQIFVHRKCNNVLVIVCNSSINELQLLRLNQVSKATNLEFMSEILPFENQFSPTFLYRENTTTTWQLECLAILLTQILGKWLSKT